tara:strand:+ start:1057 stop:2634 length:1578 start_codon:yes stop_codon:yes gene_type:complete
MSETTDDPLSIARAPGSLSTTKVESDATPAGFRFYRAVVEEYISNPADYLNRAVKDVQTGEEKKISDYMIFDTEVKENSPIVANHEISKYLPINSITCFIPQSGGRLSKNALPVIAYPFFPQHLSLPLKPGEYVWILAEEIGESQTNYYWMCRVASDRQVDDLNYTFSDRNFHIRSAFTQIITEGSITDPSDPNLLASHSSLSSTNSPIPKKVSNDKICAQSIDYLEKFTGEPVPRFFNSCADLVLQGSNNTLITMTTDKFRSADTVDSDVFTNGNASSQKSNIRRPLAGTVDIVAGRQKERLKVLSSVSDPSTLSQDGSLNAILAKREAGSSSLEHYEIDKLDQIQGRSENIYEGSIAPRSVFARMYVSMDSTPDESFEMPNADFEMQEGSTVVNYADLCRTYAEENVRICNLAGNSLIDMASDGSITLQTGDGDTAAKIILKSSGDIIIKPGLLGMLHLGGDETETSLVPVGAQGTASAGMAIGIPIISTMGGTVGAGVTVGGASPTDPTGFLSSKIMMKFGV